MKKQINIGILGFGTVGSGVVKLLQNNRSLICERLNKEISLKKIVDIDLDRSRDIIVDNKLLTHDANEIINDAEITIVVEAIGGIKAAKELVLKALRAKKNVVTSNKELIARCGSELFEAAQINKVNLLFEASVGGGIPIIRPLKICLSANRIQEVYGIVNGTTNYILSRMALFGHFFADVLKEAQKKGYAESDPSSDVDGFDAAYKISILASIAFRSKINFNDIFFEGIRKISPRDLTYAKEFGFEIKLLGIARDLGSQIDVRVHPTLIPYKHPLASVNDVYNAIFIKGDPVGEIMFYGQGAGRGPTSSAVVADIMYLAAHNGFEIDSQLGCTCLEAKAVRPIADISMQYYIRLMVLDQPGVLAKIAAVFGDNTVSIANVVQKAQIGNLAEIVIVTHKTREKNVSGALEKISALSIVAEVSNMIRVGLV